MSKQPSSAPTAIAKGPCLTIIQVVGRPATGTFPRTIAPPDHPLTIRTVSYPYNGKDKFAIESQVSECTKLRTAKIVKINEA